MKITMFWHGGSNYAVFNTSSAQDAEVFSSLQSAKDTFKARAGQNPHYPCVDEETSEAWLFLGENHPVLGGDYPDMLLRFGPCGGVVVDKFC